MGRRGTRALSRTTPWAVWRVPACCSRRPPTGGGEGETGGRSPPNHGGAPDAGRDAR